MGDDDGQDDKNEQLKALQLGLEDMLDDRDYLFRLINTIDWDAQLEAVRVLFRQHRAWSDGVSANIKRLEDEAETYRGPHHAHIVDEHTDAMFRSTFSDGVINLSAMGVIVPMIETVFSQSFHSLGSKYEVTGLTPPDHERWQRAGEDPNRWNCQWRFGRRGPKQDITVGLSQLSEAAGLTPFLPEGMMDWIVALQTYRNRMFHGGLEWSIEQRDQFEKVIEERGWDRYFTSARSDHRPWIFYLRDEVMDDMPNQMGALLDGFGRFARSMPHELVSADHGGGTDGGS